MHAVIAKILEIAYAEYHVQIENCVCYKSCISRVFSDKAKGVSACGLVLNNTCCINLIKISMIA